MARNARKGWAQLSAPQRRRYERAGITRQQYESGANLAKARGHAGPSGEAHRGRVRRQFEYRKQGPRRPFYRLGVFPRTEAEAEGIEGPAIGEIRAALRRLPGPAERLWTVRISGKLYSARETGKMRAHVLPLVSKGRLIEAARDATSPEDLYEILTGRPAEQIFGWEFSPADWEGGGLPSIGDTRELPPGEAAL